LRDPVKSIDELGMVLRGEHEMARLTLELDDQYAFGVARQLQAAVGSEVVTREFFEFVLISLVLLSIG